MEPKMNENETSVLYKENRIKLIQHNDLFIEDTENIKCETNWSPLLLVVGILTTIGSAVPVGYNIGVINAPASHIKNWCTENIKFRYNFDISIETLDILWSFIVSIYLVGGAVGSLGGAWIADRFGRKGSFLITGALFLIGAILFQFCRSVNSIEMLIIGRFIVGLASGLCTTSLPMYLTELSPLALRGTFGTFCAIGVTGGVVVGQVCSLRYIFGTRSLWHFSLSAYVLLIVICYLPSFLFPESPKYLYVIRNDREGAKKSLQKLRGVNSVELINKELDEMYIQVNSKSKSFINVIKDPKLLMPLIIVAAFMGGQQLSGINAIFYYSVSIFEKVGLSKNEAEWANLGAGCLNLLTSLASPLLMVKINRRPLMLFSCAIDAIILFIIGFSIYYMHKAAWLATISIIGIFLYIFFYQIGLGPIPYFIGAEIFETDSRPIGMAVGSLSSWICNFSIGMCFPILQTIIGAFVFIPFSITCLLLYILTKLYLPETKNRDISAVTPLISKGFRSKPFEKI